MTIDFQQVRSQVRDLGEKAALRLGELNDKRALAQRLLSLNAHDPEPILQRVDRITRQFDSNLRCAVPAAELTETPEALDFHAPLPALPQTATLIAADGSQINPDRHEQVNFGLINVGAILVRLGLPDPPRLTVKCDLIYDDALYTPFGIISEAQVALIRDLNERQVLLRLAEEAEPPVITFTDGPMELWGSRDSRESGVYEQSLKKYLGVLHKLHESGVATAGFVDKPSADLVVRLLEIASLNEDEISEAKDRHPLRGVSDRFLFQSLLDPGERSAVFSIHSRSARHYTDQLALHFFYLNVGRQGKPWLARVELPAWVAGDSQQLQNMHAVLFHQCQILGSRPFPYLIHRAHEAAVVTLEEKDQITQMIVAEQRRRGVLVDEISHKQSAKNLEARTRYER